MVSEVSIYCSIKMPPRNLPVYVSVDAHSPWEITALAASALETVTLPSRLRPYRNFEIALTEESGGKHKIFELQSTAYSHDWHYSANGISKGIQKTSGTDIEAMTDFDINFSNDSTSSETAHIFSQMQVIRGLLPEPAVKQQSTDEQGHLRKFRSLNSQPIVER